MLIVNKKIASNCYIPIKLLTEPYTFIYLYNRNSPSHIILHHGSWNLLHITDVLWTIPRILWLILWEEHMSYKYIQVQYHFYDKTWSRSFGTLTDMQSSRDHFYGTRVSFTIQATIDMHHTSCHTIIYLWSSKQAELNTNERIKY